MLWYILRDMLLDFTKIFPKSCAEQNIADLQINTADITECELELDATPWLEVIYVGDKIYKFRGDEHGLLIIKQIMMTEQLLNFFDQNKDTIDISPDTLAYSLLEAAKASNDSYKKLYQSVAIG